MSRYTAKGLCSLALATLILSGCMTRFAVLPLPEIPAMVAPDGPILGVAPTKDNRSEEQVGMVGALRIAVANDLSSYVDAVLRQRLIKLGFRALAAPDPTSLQGARLEYVFNGEVVLVTIENASLGAIDAILDPADASVTLRARVFDREGREVYSETHVGEYSETIGISVTGKTEGGILATAAHNAIDRLVESQSFKDAIR